MARLRKAVRGTRRRIETLYETILAHQNTAAEVYVGPGQDEGAAASRRIALLVATAMLDGVEPDAYIRAALEAIEVGRLSSNIDELLPWDFPTLSS